MDDRFDDWYNEVKESDSFLAIFTAHLIHKKEHDPLYTISLKKWAKRYYNQCVL